MGPYSSITLGPLSKVSFTRNSFSPIHNFEKPYQRGNGIHCSQSVRVYPPPPLNTGGALHDEVLK